MACILVDTTICVRWAELGKKESPKTRKSLKIWKVQLNLSSKKTGKIHGKSHGNSWNLKNSKEYEPFLTTKLTFQGLMCRSWVKKFKGSDFKNYFVVEYFMWIFGKNIVVHFTCVSVYHCSLIELYKVPSLLLYMYSVIWKKTHVQTFNTARDFQRNYVNLGLTDRWIIVNCSWKRQSARRVSV